VPDSFAVAYGGISLYGVADGDAIEAMCLDDQALPDTDSPPGLISGLQEVTGVFHLAIVDWCRCSVIGPASVAAYLSRR
jgi:hypothetical protein